MHFTIRVEWRRQDGTTATEELVTQNQDACKSAGDVGLPLAEAKRIVAWLQGIVVNEQVEQYCSPNFFTLSVAPCAPQLA